MSYDIKPFCCFICIFVSDMYAATYNFCPSFYHKDLRSEISESPPPVPPLSPANQATFSPFMLLKPRVEMLIRPYLNSLINSLGRQI